MLQVYVRQNQKIGFSNKKDQKIKLDNFNQLKK